MVLKELYHDTIPHLPHIFFSAHKIILVKGIAILEEGYFYKRKGFYYILKKIVYFAFNLK